MQSRETYRLGVAERVGRRGEAVGRTKVEQRVASCGDTIVVNAVVDATAVAVQVAGGSTSGEVDVVESPDASSGRDSGDEALSAELRGVGDSLELQNIVRKLGRHWTF